MEETFKFGDYVWQLSDLPEVVQDLSAAIGIDAALKTCELLGGTQVYVPSLGALKSASRQRRILADWAAGETDVNRLARKHGCSAQRAYSLIRSHLGANAAAPAPKQS